MTTIRTNSGSETLAQPRAVERVIAGQRTADGAGVKLTRVLTQPLQRRLDPFLMLDAFGTARLAGRDHLVPEDIDAKKLCGRRARVGF